MKPAAFDYQAPSTLTDALSMLGDGEDTRVLAGGQSLVPLLAMRLAQPAMLVDLNGVGELAYVRRDNGHVAIGAMTRQRDAERDPLVRYLFPVLSEALGHVGHVTIRNRGTVGGSVAHADPAAELPAAMTALDASLVLTGPAGIRTVPAADFFQSYFTTAIEPGELLTEIRLPVPAAHSGAAFEELSRRNGDFAIVGVLAAVTLDGGRVSAARIGVAGAAPTPVRPVAAEAVLVGAAPTGDVVEAAAAAVAEGINPVDDIHGTAGYRRKVSAVLTRRALHRALARAQERGA